MKQTTYARLVTALALALPGLGLAADAPAPAIEFGATVFDFGRIESGRVVKHDFVFTNTGATTLEITEVKPGCGCTTAGNCDKSVPPGRTGTIPLQFNSTGFGGQVAKSATVFCTDPRRTNIVLQLTGTVWKPIDITPSMAMFTPSSEAPTNEARILHIVNNLEEPITLSDLRCESASFKAELKEIRPGREFDLQITALPPFVSPTVFSTITMKTSSTNAPTLSVSAYAAVQQAVSVVPQQVMLPAGPLKSPFTSAVLVRNNSTNALAISDVRLELPGVGLKVTEPQTGRTYSIAITFPAGFQIEPGQKPELTFRSDHPRFPITRVPILQNQPALSAPPLVNLSAAAPAHLQTASPVRAQTAARSAGPLPALSVTK